MMLRYWNGKIFWLEFWIIILKYVKNYIKWLHKNIVLKCFIEHAMPLCTSTSVSCGATLLRDMESRSGDSASSPSVKSSPDLASDISSAVPPSFLHCPRIMTAVTQTSKKITTGR